MKKADISKLKSSIFIYVVAIILTSRILDFNVPEMLYYVTIILLFIGYYWKLPSIKILDKNLFVLLIVLFLSIVLNDIPSFFKPYERYVSFLFIVLLFSAAFMSNQLIKFRERVFFAIINLFCIYTVVSFIGLLVGIYPLIGKGGFQGMLNHSMMMSPVASIAGLYMVYRFFSNEKKRIYICVVAVICLIVVVIGGSRGALLSMFIGLVIFFYKCGLLTIKALPKLSVLLVVIGLLLLFMPQTYFEQMTHKFNVADDAGSIIYTRESLWRARLLEFEKNPVLGVGFSSIDLSQTTDFGDKFDIATGNIEPGSSWLVVLSMSGLLGFLFLVLMCVSRIRAIYRSVFAFKNGFIASVFGFLMFHMVFEGYIFASGSILMIMFWLTYFMTYKLDYK